MEAEPSEVRAASEARRKARRLKEGERQFQGGNDSGSSDIEAPTTDDGTDVAVSQWDEEDKETEDLVDCERLHVDLAKIKSNLTLSVAKVFEQMFSNRAPSPEAAADRPPQGRPPLRTQQQRTCPNPRCQGQALDVVAKSTTGRRPELVLSCKCGRKLCTLAVGDCLSLGGDKFAMVRGWPKESKGRSVHLQTLEARFSPYKGTSLNLISNSPEPPVLLLRAEHKSVCCEDFVRSWAQGGVNVLQRRPALMYAISQPGCPRDFVSVPDDAPPFSCCGCGCINMWGIQHKLCKRAAPSSSCALASCGVLGAGEGAAVGIQPGDWVWVLPPAAHIVDQELELGRVLTTWSDVHQGKVRGSAHVLKYRRHDTSAGHCFQPSKEEVVVPSARLQTVPDPFSIVGVTVQREDGLLEQPPPVAELPKLELLDLFSGYGGLSLGFELSGVAEAAAAVDLFSAALETFRASHSHTAKTFAMDVCDFLRGVKEGKEGFPAASPQPGKLRLIVAGPPCQGFSGANKQDKELKAAKNANVPLFISAVETLQADYVVMENVVGLTREEGVMEGVTQALLSLGYQVRWRLVNCGMFGVATHRRRMVLLAAKAGLPLPNFPAPTHVFNAGGYLAASPEAGCSLEARQQRALAGVPERWRAHVLVPTNAPLPRLSVQDVIGDLQEAAADDGAAVGYAREPTCYYQRQLRGDLEQVSCHQHYGMGGTARQRISLIPKALEGQPGEGEGACPVTEHPNRPCRAGDWRDLPPELQPGFLKERRQQRGTLNAGIYGRLLWCGQFGTLLTSMVPDKDTANCIIHPSADRPLTCREAARVQGIPDRVDFKGSVTEKYRQIGNSVPVPLGVALGKELKRALQRMQPQAGQPSVR